MRKPKFPSIFVFLFSMLSINLFAQEIVTQKMTSTEAQRYEELRKTEQALYQKLFEEEETYYKALMKNDSVTYQNYMKARKAAQKAGLPMPLPPEGYAVPKEESYEVDNKTSKISKPEAQQRDY